jgi:glycine hydroxymethyltransferase
MSQPSTPGARFRQAVEHERPLQVMGTINAYCALLAREVGFRALYLSGAGVANASRGLPDLGLTTLDDVVTDARRITAAVDLPLLVDIDTGFEDITSTIEEMINAGVAAVHMEDQVEAKRCGHRPGKRLVSTQEMCSRIRAAVQARYDESFVVMARTDAAGVETFDAALDRARRYVDAGADMIFAEALTTLDEYGRFAQAVSVPVLANITEFGRTPLFTAEQLGQAGVRLMLFPLSGFRAMSRAAQHVYRAIRQDGTQQAVVKEMQTRVELYEVLDYYEQERRVDTGGRAAGDTMTRLPHPPGRDTMRSLRITEPIMSSATEVDSAEAVAGSANPLAARDPQIWQWIEKEQRRQESTLELIASENHTSAAVMAAVGSCLTNKYAEGYPGARYYGGCGNYDEIENLARQRAGKLFGCRFANVQPHSGANANFAVFYALLEPGDTYLSVVLSDGGHLTHGSPVNISGKWFKPVHYPLVYDRNRPDYGRIDYDAVAALASEHRPKLILCGYSAYPRIIDFERFRQIADSVGALLMADIAHIAGLVAGQVHPSPFPHAHVVTTTTHKTLRGPRGGLILTNDEELARKIDRAVFPGTQGGPLMHVIAGKAVCFGEALEPSFKQYGRQIVSNAQALAQSLVDKGWELTSRGTDNHLMVLDFTQTHPEVSGKDAARWLEAAGLITSQSTVPNDPRPPYITSGVRLGTAALTTRGMAEGQMRQVAQFIDRVLKSGGDEAMTRAVREEVTRLCAQFRLPH